MDTLFLSFLLAVPVLGLVLLAWHALPPAWVAWRRARVLRQPFPSAWRGVLRRRMPLYRRLPPVLQRRLQQQVQVLLAEVPFIGCQGQRVTDEVRVLVAAQAALLRLGRPPGAFRALTQVLVYPGAFIVDRPLTEGGVVREARRVLLGESWQRGQLILAWDAVLAGAADPTDGRNVVIHEFAHQLDQENGPANGAPVLGSREAYGPWSVVMGEHFRALQGSVGRGEPTLIDAYGATDEAEFFAVVSELFFERPDELAQRHPRLHEQLVTFYGVDPRSWGEPVRGVGPGNSGNA